MAEPIEKVRDRMEELYNQVFELGDRSPENLERSFESMSILLEEAQNFYEELRVRNEELIIARQALEDERRRYQELFEFAPDAYVVTDAHGGVSEANQAAARMLAIRQDHLIGKPLRIFVAPDARGVFSHLLGSQSGANQVEVDLQTRAGERITAEVTMRAVPGIGGKAGALRWVLRDVSEREKERQAMAASENRFRTIFQDAHVSMLLVGVGGMVIESNRAFHEMTGYSPAYIHGHNADDLVHPEDQAKFSRILQAFSDGITDYTRLEIRYPTVDGGTVWARVSISLLRDPNHLPRNTIHMIENITQEKQSAAEVVEMKRKMLEGIEAERLRLAQELHDGPMQDLYAAVFKLSSDIFEMPRKVSGLDGTEAKDRAEAAAEAQPVGQADGRPADGSVREHVEETQEMLKQVAGTLRSICGELRPPTLVNLGLERAIRSHMERMMSQYPEMTVQLDLADDRGRLNAEQRLALFRVYQQCISNVLRHARAADVGIQLKIEKGHAVLSVWDNGHGFVMPSKLVELTREGHYGLAGIAERVEALGGAMSVQTAPGQGTLVRVVVPVQE